MCQLLAVIVMMTLGVVMCAGQLGVFEGPGDDPATACERGDSEGCLVLGVMYAYGAHGVVKDEAKAAAWFEKACSLNSGEGCGELGVLYALGTGVLKDDAKAVELYEKACSLNSGVGCIDLGNRYEIGTGVLKDEAKAAELYEKACRLAPAHSQPIPPSLQGQGLVNPNGMVCARLGLLYRDGIGVTKDDAKAAELFEKACSLNQGQSCALLGLLYHNGTGVTKDEAKAAEFYEKACSLDENECRP